MWSDPPALVTAAALPESARAGVWPWLAQALGLAVVLAGAWQGGWPGVATALPGALLTIWGAARRAAGPVAAMAGMADDPVAETPLSMGRDPRAAGANLMVQRVVPVWAKQMDVTREASEAGMAELLQGFSTISTLLSELTEQLESYQPATAPGALGDAVVTHAPALETLLQPVQRAFDQRAAAVDRLGACARALTQLQQLSREAREIGRHTRLVAFNASIEANRQQPSTRDGGSQQVAAEVRTLSERVVAVCDRLDALTAELAQASADGHRAGLVGDTNPEELRLECELRAREALQLMMTSLGGAMHGAVRMREAGHAVSHALDEVFTHFQFGDRISQMLQIVGQDMTNFSAWVAAHPQATVGDAQAWLLKLEKSYTMDEQRANHHGHQHVDRGSEVDFF